MFGRARRSFALIALSCATMGLIGCPSTSGSRLTFGGVDNGFAEIGSHDSVVTVDTRGKDAVIFWPETQTHFVIRGANQYAGEMIGNEATFWFGNLRVQLTPNRALFELNWKDKPSRRYSRATVTNLADHRDQRFIVTVIKGRVEVVGQGARDQEKIIMPS